jgi:hypothetical protein
MQKQKNYNNNNNNNKTVVNMASWVSHSFKIMFQIFKINLQQACRFSCEELQTWTRKVRSTKQMAFLSSNARIIQKL